MQLGVTNSIKSEMRIQSFISVRFEIKRLFEIQQQIQVDDHDYELNLIIL